MNLLNLTQLLLAATLLLARKAAGCGPGRGPMRRRGPRKIHPLIFKQHEPNFSERSLAASGLPEGFISREDEAFRHLVPNYNPDILFKDEEGTGADRIMTQRCKEKLNTLAISVMNQWPGIRLRVTEAWDEENHHSRNSLHYEGRAVDLTTSDRDRAKYGLLASLAVEAGFDWVYYESRSHIHVSCSAESAHPSKNGGCFPGQSHVVTEAGQDKLMKDVVVGDKIRAVDNDGNIIYSEVLMFLDRDTEESRQYLALRTVEGSVLTLTPNHLVHSASADCDHHSCFTPTFSERVKPGHQVLVDNKGKLVPQTVASVDVISEKGVFAPLTAAGNLVVDGVLASSYAVIDSHTIAHAAFAPVRWWANLKHNGAYLVRTLSPLNSGATPRTESFPPSGVPWYPNFLYSVASYLLPSHLL